MPEIGGGGPWWAGSVVLWPGKGGGCRRQGRVREGGTVLFDGWMGASLGAGAVRRKTVIDSSPGRRRQALV